MADKVDWRDLQNAWQQPPKDRLPKLEKLLRRRSWMIWILTANDVLFTLLGLAWLTWFVSKQPTAPRMLFAVFFVLLMVASWWLVLRIRRGTWRVDTAAPAAMVELSIRRCKASIRLALLNQWSVGLAFLIAFFLRAAGLRAPGLGFEVSWWLRGVILSLAAVWFLAATIYKDRKRQELPGLIELREQLRDAD